MPCMSISLGNPARNKAISSQSPPLRLPVGAGFIKALGLNRQLATKLAPSEIQDLRKACVILSKFVDFMAAMRP